MVFSGLCQKPTFPNFLLYSRLTRIGTKTHLPMHLRSIFVPSMKAAAAFLLCLFFLLLGGSKPAQATGHDTLRSYAPFQHLQKQGQSSPLRMRLANLPVHNHSISDKKESLTIDFDDDDFQEDYVFSRKYVLPLSYFIVLASLSLLSGFFAFVKNRLPFCAHFSFNASPRYILQRVLRL